MPATLCPGRSLEWEDRRGTRLDRGPRPIYAAPMTVKDKSCIFCAIVSGEAPRSVVHEDDTTLAFMDILPVTPGHLLVVPKDHAALLAEVPEATGARMMEVAMRCAAALRSSPLLTEGINLFLADGEVAGQEIPHAHIHVLPRFADDGFGLSIRYEPPPARERLDEYAELIRSELGRPGGG